MVERSASAFSIFTSLLADPKYPGRADEQEQQCTEYRRQQPQAIEFTLGQVVTCDENDVLAAALRRQRGEVTAGKQQGEPHQVYRDAGLDPDIKKHPEQGQYLRRLADEHVVHEDIDQQQGDISDRPGYVAEHGGQTFADITHETEFVELAA